MPRAGCLVHAGEVGTTAQAMRSGRPMLVVPSCNDQLDNADHVRRLGIARSAAPPRWAPWSRRAAGARPDGRSAVRGEALCLLLICTVLRFCQCKVQMSGSLQSRNVGLDVVDGNPIAS